MMALGTLGRLNKRESNSGFDKSDFVRCDYLLNSVSGVPTVCRAPGYLYFNK